MIYAMLEFLLQAIGAVTAVGLLVALGMLCIVMVTSEGKALVLDIIQSRKDTKLFHQIEEFRRDFS